MNTSTKGLPYGYRRVTIVLNDKYYQKIRELAYHDKTTHREILDLIMYDWYKRQVGSSL